MIKDFTIFMKQSIMEMVVPVCAITGFCLLVVIMIILICIIGIALGMTFEYITILFFSYSVYEAQSIKIFDSREEWCPDKNSYFENLPVFFIVGFEFVLVIFLLIILILIFIVICYSIILCIRKRREYMLKYES